MPMGNVPDDWNTYYRTCCHCGGRYHASEGGCSCYEERAERAAEAMMDELRNAKKIELSRMTEKYGFDTDQGESIKPDMEYVRLFVELGNTHGCSFDEYPLSEDAWQDTKKILGLTDDPPSPEEE